MMTRNRFIVPLILAVCMVLGCQDKSTESSRSKQVENRIELNNDEPPRNTVDQTVPDTIVLSRTHKPSTVHCDLDGDNLTDTVQIVQNTKNEKYGLRFIFGNKKIEYLGMGTDILGQGFDDIDWVGIFEKAPKEAVYWNNVNDDGEIITDEEVKEADKIKLVNDGIFIHQAESCGGGIIYLNKGKFAWIQQE
ncbi:hypothetical protein OHD16_20435 [Sphingobacterium sp. ML3W]|uniref:hypothetical protein n=1 Tax=Sphingobacterium sp. ML3W TaxID=1538644 RepID=UPI00249B36CF|nr:hypothetical protein [Sphingobacterium sp. ML3W]WFA82329.1 hypothetical protein OGI71_13575 [Sphingobacterium sp. ML3W]